jgi:uncharacterized protein YndB with AHSA1/START domain
MTPPSPLVARTAVSIDAPASRVWSVLTDARLFGRWDEAPDARNGDSLELGSGLLWMRMDGEYTKLTVTVFEPPSRLKLALYGSTWPLPPDAYDVGYTYSVAERFGRAALSIEIGDFAEILHSQDYYDAAVEFAARAAWKIKKLAEARPRASIFAW